MNRQQILSVMEPDVNNSLAVFNAAAADLMNSTYIIASGKISKLLQGVAQSRPLYEFLARETSGYNFVDDFRARQFRDRSGRPYISVPNEPREQIRFAFCMLFAIDTGKLNIENLLHTFYFDTDPNTELRQFCNEIVRPFVENLNVLMTSPQSPEPEQSGMGELNIDLSDVQNFAPTDAEQLAAPQPKLAPSSPLARLFEEERAELPAAPEESSDVAPLEGAYAALVEVASEIVDIVSHDITLSILAREEILLVCDAFNTAVSLGESKPIRLMYIALKNTIETCAIFPELESRRDELRDLIAQIGIHA